VLTSTNIYSKHVQLKKNEKSYQHYQQSIIIY